MNQTFWDGSSVSLVKHHHFYDAGFEYGNQDQPPWKFDIFDHGVRDQQDGSKKTKHSWQSGYHTRLDDEPWEGYGHAEDRWGNTTAGSVHWDRRIDCGKFGISHVARNFDGARDEVGRDFDFYTKYSNHGHTRGISYNQNWAPSLAQCDGSLPHSVDGETHWWRMPRTIG